MKEKEVIVTISGGPKTGKSRILYLMKEFLRNNGFDVRMLDGNDFQNEVHFDIAMNKDINESIGAIKKRTTVIFQEQND